MRALLLLTLMAACGGQANVPEPVSKPQTLPPPVPVPSPSQPKEPIALSSEGPPPAPPKEEPVAAPEPPKPKVPVEMPACEAEGRVLASDGRSCRERRFADYCRDGVEMGEEEELTVSRILNTLELSDCVEVERLLERRPILILPPNGQKITDLKPIGTLRMLRVLHLANNRIVDVSPLAALRELETLDLRDNAIGDVSPLTTLTKLRRLDLSGNDTRDVSALSRLPRLTHIEIGPAGVRKREPVTMRGISAGSLE